MSVDSRTSLHEERVADREAVNIEEKNRIARYAASLIMPDDFIYIDAGTTTAAMIPFITEHSAVYVTNAVAHGLELARRGFRVNLIGGEIRTPTEAIVGSAACEELRSYNFTKCFMGTNGADPDSGFTTPDIGEAAIKGRAMAQSRQRYILCTAVSPTSPTPPSSPTTAPTAGTNSSATSSSRRICLIPPDRLLFTGNKQSSLAP